MSQDNYQKIIELLPRLRRFAYGLTGSVEAAEDLVQEACVKVLHDYKDKSSYIERWLFRIIRNLHIDQIRNSAVADRYHDQLRNQEVRHFDGSGFLETLLTLDQVKSAIFELSEDQRTVLLLIGVEGFSYKETAEILDLPIGTVTSRLARARQRVMEIVTANSEGQDEPTEVVNRGKAE